MDKFKLSWQLAPKSMTVPPEVILPSQFLPEYKYHDFWLDDEKDIPKFLKKYEKSKDEEENKVPKEEPRYVTQILESQKEAFIQACRF